jgi:hypothetical protein
LAEAGIANCRGGVGRSLKEPVALRRALQDKSNWPAGWMLPMAEIGHLPAYDATAIIGGRVGRSLQGGFGGVTPIQTRGGDKILSDLYGTRPEETIRQRRVAPLGVTPRADYGLMTLRGSFGLPIYTGPILGNYALDIMSSA